MQSPINIGRRATGSNAHNVDSTIFRRRIAAISTNVMCIDLGKLKTIVSELLYGLDTKDFQDEEEQLLSLSTRPADA